MTEAELLKAAREEADALRYYGQTAMCLADPLDDCDFYDRIQSIGYAKRAMPLESRCPRWFVTSPDKPVLECEPGELVRRAGPRNHGASVYTPLEYLIATGLHREQLVRIIRGDYLCAP